MSRAARSIFMMTRQPRTTLPSAWTLALLALLPSTACAPRDDQPDLTDVATRYAAAWSSQNPMALASFYAETGSLTVNEGEPAIGREAIAAKAAAFMEAFPDMVVRMETVEGEGRHATFRWHWTGTNTGPGGTGRPVDLRGYEEWTFDEKGLIVQSLGHYDTTEYEHQVGSR